MALLASRGCPAQAEGAALEKRQQVAVNLGSVQTIEIPASWKREESPPAAACTFVKRRKSWSDCLSKLEIAPAVVISSKQFKALDSYINSGEIAKEQINALKDLPSFGTATSTTDEVTKRFYSISKRKVFVVEHRGQFNGPCEQVAGGRSRMPRLNYLRGTVYLISGTNTLQIINFDTDVMGETKPCLEQIRAILNSIKWRESNN